MVTRNADGSRCTIHLFVLLFTAIFLLGGCDTAAPNTTQSGAQNPTLPDVQTATPTPQAQITGPLLPTQTPTSQPSALHGPTNFLLSSPLQFSSVNGSTKDGGGTTTQLDANTIEAGINGEFKHLLFVIDSNGGVKVYNPGSTTPITAQITQHTDGSTTIDYTQTSNSEAGSFSLTFEGTLFKDQIMAIYEQQFSPLIISSVAASDVKVAFTAHVRWVSAGEIPATPTNGTYHLTSNGEIALSWSGGQNAVAYDVYRLIPNRDQQFQLLGTVKDASYNENSPIAIQSAHSKQGIGYAIFSIGPTGVENPVSIVIAVAAP